jgi:two-component system chemotaxis response regulator CheB
VAAPTALDRCHGFSVVVLAASTGGLRALRTVVAGLPADFPVPVLVVQHRGPGHPEMLADLLGIRADVPTRTASAGPLLTGVTVVPAGTTADLGADGSLTLRPHPTATVADAVLVSAAAAFGPHVLAVVLTGRQSDGAAGIRAVRRAGGRVLVQDPEDAEAPAMPRAALATGCVEHALPLPLVAPALVAYVMAPGAADLLAVPVPPWARLTPHPSVPA